MVKCRQSRIINSLMVNLLLACERRRISGCRLSSGVANLLSISVFLQSPPPNPALDEVADGLIRAWELYGSERYVLKIGLISF